ncbi:molybdenum cofactor guanylyltransferase MobA [Methylobacterium oxalidis]|uniref:molybdenum cofactor guanylyltransferase MobA n=1 Tax=Methylobacterium oxalidis TaxID=944322 RepID=UPI0038B35709
MTTLGVVLAGGLSRRMGGGDKPLRVLAGRTLLDRVVGRLAPQCPAGLILNVNGDPERFGAFPGAVVPDGVPGNPGPLAGILAALEHARTHHPRVEQIASVTGDAPFLPLDLVARLGAARRAGGAPIAMAASGGREHFTTALWAVSLTDDLRAALVERDERRVGAYLARHGAVPVAWPIEPVDPFLNVNTPEDLDLAASMLARVAEG